MPLTRPSAGLCAACARRSIVAWTLAPRGGTALRQLHGGTSRPAARRPKMYANRAKKLIPSGYVASANRSLVKREDVKYSMFERLVEAELQYLFTSIADSTDLWRSWGIESRAKLAETTKAFVEVLEKSFEEARTREPDQPAPKDTLFDGLREAYIEGDRRELKRKLRHFLASHAINSRFTDRDVTNQRQLADLRYPSEWFPATRSMQRTIHLHVGPTNSGKTYRALKRLEEAKTGIYAGPLRLLAHEVYSRLNNNNKQCALITGEERRIPDDMMDYVCSCTVEMMPLNVEVDVAVIDEIQMMGDKARGWAWTQALLGVKAKEIHLCGELRTIPLVRDLCKSMGDQLLVHEYQRLSPLQTAKSSMHGDLKNLQKGDAIIVFNRIGIHAKKKEIEEATGRRCAVVYGSLPPEIRAQQAALFNDPDNDYDFLVASDAVGMGLNLSIRRVIFQSMEKNNGIEFVPLTVPQIKQIGGRAGRYKVPLPKVSADDESKPDSTAVKERESTVGVVTTMLQPDFHRVRSAMKTEVGPLKTAGIYPPASVLQRFAAYFPPAVPFSYVLTRLHEIAAMHPRFHLCSLEDQINTADVIQPFDMSVGERIVFCAAPVSLRDSGTPAALRAFARCVSKNQGGNLLDIKEVNLELLDTVENAADPSQYLQDLESLHKVLTLYLWLSYRFAGVFKSQALATHVHKLVEAKIQQCLETVKMRSNQNELHRIKLLQQANRKKRRRIAEGLEAGESTPALEQPPPLTAAEYLNWDGQGGHGSEEVRPEVVEDAIAEPKTEAKAGSER